MRFFRTVRQFLIYLQFILYAISGDAFGCNEEMIREVISSEIKHLPFRVNEHFDNFAKDFEMILYDDFKYNESNPGQKSQTGPYLEFKFPYFSRHFKSNLRHPSFKNTFKNIVDIFDVAQNKFKEIWKKYDLFIETSLSEARDKVANLTDKLSTFQYKIYEDSENIRCKSSDQNSRKVWCNHSYEGGNWTVILRREHQRIQLDFRRSFTDYENGFGDPEGEYWIGLKDLHHMTNHRPNELLVLMSIKSERAFAKYRHFRVGDPPGYELRVAGYDEKSTAGNSLSYHNEMLFSTFDVDRDNDEVRSCSADSGGGGFWFNFCYYTNPTGVYPPEGLPQGTALNSMLEWRRWQGFHAYLSSFAMMIRPRT